MKNILSYQAGTIFSGREIKQWAFHHYLNHTSHERNAKRILNKFIIKDDRYYTISIEANDTGHGLGKRIPILRRVKYGKNQ